MTAFDFVKYHGTGNDFILVDNRKGEINLKGDEISSFCQRWLGIGADGMIFLHSSGDYDFEMKYFNADGAEGTMCGNGGRCISAFASDLGIVGREARFKAVDGLHKALIHSAKGDSRTVEVSLIDVGDIRKVDDTIFMLNTGSPHFVQFIPDLDAVDAFREGKRIRWDDRFGTEGNNVNFVQRTGTQLKVKTFERGVENTTLSCGTGVSACALAASAGMENGPYTWNIFTPGGNLTVSFVKENGFYRDIWLKGPATRVFAGSTMR